jgi:sugar/nucleoside kinase (ribokinase family)
MHDLHTQLPMPSSPPACYDFDVIVYGTVCLDLIWRVDRLATPGGYASITQERRMIGGEAANTAIALTRWGLRVALVGTAMGDDDDGRLLRKLFEELGSAIDLRHVETIPGLQTPFCACIATPDGHRTMYGIGFTNMHVPRLEPEFARRARVFTMDPNAYDAGLAACAVAAEAGTEVVAMDYTRSPEVNRVSSISVTSHEHVQAGAILATYADYAAATRDREGCTVVVTCGDCGCFIAERAATGSAAIHVPAYFVDDIVDSTGCGDMFRAGLIYGQLQGWDIVTTARFASAAAGLNCMQMGGWGGVRSVAEIQAFQRTAEVRTRD